MTRLKRAFSRPIVASLAIAVAVFALVFSARELGLLQSAEFLAYDKFLGWRAPPDTTDSRIVIVETTENDLARYDFPIPDDLLAKVLSTIAKAKPVAIGLDIYRDMPVPRNGNQIAQLNQVLRENQNIVGIFKFGDPEHPIKISFAPALAETPDRYGFNDLPFELGAVRRSFLFLWDNQGNVYPSFALALALHAGVALQQNGSDLRVGKALFPRFRSNDGAYIRAQDGGHQFLLDFKSPRKFSTYSLDDVVSNRTNDETWQNKIVLIGEGAESAHDFETTPLQANAVGVELNAQILNQLLRAGKRGDKPTTSWSEPVELGWLFAWCVIGGIVGFFVRRPIVLLGVSGLVAAGLALICWIAFQHDLWLPFVPALGGNLAAVALVTGYIRFQEKRDRETLMGLFSKNVSPAVATSIWEHRDEFMDGRRPQPQRLFATVLFSDFRNFSTVSEKLSPDEAMKWINEYMEALAQHVDRHGGLIDKFIGDAIMAIFGFPLSLTAKANPRKDAHDAVQCAVDMGKELARLNDEWIGRIGTPVHMRIGIFSGPAVAGCVGSADRLDFTLIGDTVNTASRLESFDKDYASDQACRILIGQNTLDLLDGHFATEFVQTIKLKGKNEPTNIHRVIVSQT
jgi:adenylate cyclase